MLLADGTVVRMGAEGEVHGATAVATTFTGRARFAEMTLLDGAPGAVWTVHGRARVAFAFTIENGRIVEIELLADPLVLDRLAATTSTT